TTPRQAKYFRALPLHPSQQETIHDDYSIFTYQLKLNYELAHEILALGDAVKVLDPPELKAMVITQLHAALNQYDS
ncbi:MAG: WYL domain-containing protein, partial [Muribaculaceae bacterium]|nr:WYL domain-containing protein [Muribaculaceae bacterium]